MAIKECIHYVQYVLSNLEQYLKKEIVSSYLSLISQSFQIGIFIL